MNPIIRVEHLRKVYRVGKEKVVALNDVSLSILPGEVCCIVGASGSGKSTLLNQLAGLEKPTRGRVLIGRHEISAMTENELAAFRQAHLGFIFQSYNLLPNLTAAENVALPLMFKGVPRKQRQKMAVEQLKLMGLAKRAGHKPTEMSGGQQQRVGIARAFVTRPKVIFADEPTGNLDTKTTRQVLRSMLEMAKEHGITFVMVTHEKDLAGIADRLDAEVRSKNASACAVLLDRAIDRVRTVPHQKSQALWLCGEIRGVLAARMGEDFVRSWLPIERLATREQVLVWLQAAKNQLAEQLAQSGHSRSLLGEKACRYVQDNVDKHIMLQDVADYVCISPGYLSALFKKEYNQNFVDYINEVKIKRAQALIREGKYRIYEISYMLGFENAYYFTRVFKRYTGMTPSEYQKQQRGGRE